MSETTKVHLVVNVNKLLRGEGAAVHVQVKDKAGDDCELLWGHSDVYPSGTVLPWDGAVEASLLEPVIGAYADAEKLPERDPVRVAIEQHGFRQLVDLVKALNDADAAEKLLVTNEVRAQLIEKYGLSDLQLAG